MAELFQSIDKRIAAWLELKRKMDVDKIADRRLRSTITISREFGCEGYPLARALKEKLDGLTGQTWTIFDEDAVDTISSAAEMSAQLPEDFGERGRFLDGFVAALLPSWKTEAEHYASVAKTIFAIAQQGHAIIVGRAAFAITQDLENCFHFRLIAPRDFRIGCYAKRNQLSTAEAEKTVVEKETARIAFLQDFLNLEFDLHYFHLILNDAKLANSQKVDIILRFLESAANSL